MADEESPVEGPALSGRSVKDERLPKVRPETRLYWGLYLSCWFTYAVLIFWGWREWDHILFSVGPLNFNVSPLLWGLVSTHLGLSLEKVETNEVAGKYFYGVPLFKARPGLNYVPFGLMNLIRYPADIQEIFLPGKPDDVFWGDEKADLPPGMVRPIWVPTRAPKDVEKEPLDAQMVVGIVGYAFWRIVDVFTFHAHVGSVEESTSQVRSIWVRVLSQDIVKHTASGAIDRQAELNGTLDDSIRTHTNDWGIQVTSAGITKINVSHELGSSMRDRAKARFDQETKNIESDAKAYEAETVGAAEAKVIRLKEAAPLEGRAQGLAAMAKVLKDSPEAAQALAADTARELMERANVIFAGGAENSIRDLMAGARAVQESMGHGSKEGGNAKPS